MLQYANILTWWHPVRFAEQSAMLDVISKGRVEFGLGRGYQPREVEVFGRTYGSTIQDQERNRSSFEEALELLLKAWTEPSFSHHGENFSIPPLYTKWHHNMTIELLSQPGYERSVEQVLSSPSRTCTRAATRSSPRPQAVAERPLAIHDLASHVNERMDVLRRRQDRREAVAGQLPTALGLVQHKQLVIATRDLGACGEDSDGAV